MYFAGYVCVLANKFLSLLKKLIRQVLLSC